MLGSRSAASSGLMKGQAARTPALGGLRAAAAAARGARKAQRSGADRRRVVVAAAEPDAGAPAPQQRKAAEPTRPLATLQPNDVLEGTVTSIQTFGCFVEVGAESQGLVHVSQLSDGFVKNVADFVKVGDVVKVRVLNVDPASKRLALSRKGFGVGAAPSGGGRGGRSERGSGGGAMNMEDAYAAAVAAEEEAAGDPNSAELDGLLFVVEDAEAGGGDEELDPAEVEFVEDIPAEVAREIAIACEDLIHGTVKAVDASGVTVSYTLEDGSEVTGVIAKAELLAPAHLVAGASAAAEEGGEEGRRETAEYVEVDDIAPPQYYKVGDAISCAVLDVEAGGKPVLTQRLAEEADDELAELAAELDQFDNIDDVSSALLIEGLWAAGEAAGEDDEVQDNGDALLEELDPSAEAQAAAALAAAADEEAAAELLAAATTPDELRAEVYAKRSGSAPALLGSSSMLGGGVTGISLPDRALNISPSAQLTGVLMEQYASQADLDDCDEDELIGVSVADTSYIPRSLLKRIGYKLVQDEESGEWEAVQREGADQIEMTPELEAELQAIAAGTAIDPRDVNDIVRDLMASDEDLEEAEVPLRARRNPVVAAAAVTASISAADVKALRTKTGAGMMDCKKALAECDGDADKAMEWLRQKGLAGADKKAGRIAAEGAIVRYIHPGARLGVLLEVNCETDFVAAGEAFTSLAGELAMVIASSDVVCVSVDDMPADLLAKEREVEMGKEDILSKPEAVRAKIVEGRLDKIKRAYALLEQPALRDNNKTVGELIKETIAATGENIQVRRFVRLNLGEGLEKRSNDFAAEVAQQTQAKDKKADKPAAAADKQQPKQEPEAAAKPAVQVSAGLVKQLRDKSGAGMMDCKKALAECAGDIEAASEWLRKKGLASADKKAGRLAAEGALVAYIHPGARLGVLLEVNCETDFVAAGEDFNRLANTVAMQLAASPSVEYVAIDEIPEEVYAREKEIEMGREDLQGKPEAIRAKIAEGRVKKLVQERVLLEQPYLLDQNKTVAEAVKEAIAACGENIQVRRFVRYNLGEGVEKKESNLAAEVAAATGGKA